MLKSTVDYPNNNYMSILGGCQAMEKYEDLTVYEHWGNSFCGARKAKLYAGGRLIYEPEPECELDEETQGEPEEGEDEDE
jgi:hypothetical protein